jgi:predicted kinase
MSIDRGDQPGAGDDLVDPQPGSREHLGRRLGNLSPGHPSFPHDSFPAGSDRRSERPRPLTDAEHADHVRDIRARLDKARANGLATDRQYALDSDREAWTRERRNAHESILRSLYGRPSAVPSEWRAIMVGGLPGSGKSTVLRGFLGIDHTRYATINPDEIKEELAFRGMIPDVEGLSPMEASVLAHEESSHVARQLASLAQGDGANVIWDITMSSRVSTERRIQELRAAGYVAVEGVFVDLTVEESAVRADLRHRNGHEEYRAGGGLGGRFVPPEIISGQADREWGSVNRRSFEAIKGQFDQWSLYSNSSALGEPKLLNYGPI